MKSIVPARELYEINMLKGPHEFFPASLYYQSGMPRNLYKHDGTDRILPAYFKGQVSLKNTRQTKAVHIYLHGFTSPAKWHFGVAKHVLGMTDFGGSSGDKKRWEAFEGKKVGSVEASVFDRCRTNNNRTSCHEGVCRTKGCFSKIHPFIKDYCRRYLRQALAFFPERTAFIRIWNGNRLKPTADPKIAEVKCVRQVRENPFSERHDTLILRGYSYDWTSQDEPTLHLCMLTLYAGSYSTVPYPHTRTRFDKGTLLGYGKLRIL